MNAEEKQTVIKTHYAVIANGLGSEEKALEFLAWLTTFFAESPDILRELAKPKIRENVFKKAAALMNNPLLKNLI